MLSFDVTQNIPNPSLVQTHRILVVEDEDVIRDMIVLALEEEGYDITAVSDGRTALNLLQKENSNHHTTETEFDLLILDLMLPQINGLDICRLLRYQGNIVPILILSAKASETDRVLGLEVGADDYLTKPFSMRELVARCRALIRRKDFSNSSSAAVKKFRDITLFTEECRVMVGEEQINLSPKEYRLLDLFMSYPRRVWSRDQLI